MNQSVVLQTGEVLVERRSELNAKDLSHELLPARLLVGARSRATNGREEFRPRQLPFDVQRQFHAHLETLHRGHAHHTGNIIDRQAHQQIHDDDGHDNDEDDEEEVGDAEVIGSIAVEYACRATDRYVS